MDDEKIIISIQIPKFIHEKLKEQALADCSSVSYLIRKAIIKFANSAEDNENGK